MKYLVISDTHGKINYAVDTIRSTRCDYCIHLGDMVQDCEDLQSIFPKQKFIFVKGNNDYWTNSSDFPEQRVFELEGKRFFVCHGHKYNVKCGIHALVKAAKSENADICLFGHTHVQYFENSDGLLVVNPGAYDKYAVITIKNNDVNCEVFSYGY